MVLKPQDVYVTLKIVASQADRAPYSQLAAELVMSPSEVHASVRRAEGSHLLHGPQRKNRPNGADSRVGFRRRTPPSRSAALSRKGTSRAPFGHTRRASNGASRLSRCTRPPPSRPCAIRLFTSTWPSPTPCGTAASGNENLLRPSCAVGSGKPMNGSNREQLIIAGRLLRPLLGELVFVGGTVTGLLITDGAAAGPRTTHDVDAIGCERWGSKKTREKGRRCAGGPITEQRST
jgi:DNA-binding Lrp family transcriptional regulator